MTLQELCKRKQDQGNSLQREFAEERGLVIYISGLLGIPFVDVLAVFLLYFEA